MSNFTPMSSVFEANGTSHAGRSARLYRCWGEQVLLQELQPGLVFSCVCELKFRQHEHTTHLPCFSQVPELYCHVVIFFPSKIGNCSSFFLTYTPDLKRARFQFFRENNPNLCFKNTEYIFCSKT